MDDAFRHAFAVERRHLLEQLIILHQQGAARAGGQRILIVADRVALGGGQLLFLGHRDLLFWGRRVWLL